MEEGQDYLFLEILKDSKLVSGLDPGAIPLRQKIG